jgi:hypothetical protein
MHFPKWSGDFVSDKQAILTYVKHRFSVASNNARLLINTPDAPDALETCRIWEQWVNAVEPEEDPAELQSLYQQLELAVGQESRQDGPQHEA